MKNFTLAVAACLAAAGVVVASAGGSAPEDEWVSVLEHTFDEARVRRPENQAAMGASVLGFLAGEVHATVLVDNNDRKGVSVFVGWGGPAELRGAVGRELRAVFVDQAGERHPRPLSGGGNHALLYYSPGDVPLSELQSLELQHAADAEWAGN